MAKRTGNAAREIRKDTPLPARRTAKRKTLVTVVGRSEMIKAMRSVSAWWRIHKVDCTNYGAPACIFEVNRLLDQIDQYERLYGLPQLKEEAL
jgi:hypothetical protein